MDGTSEIHHGAAIAIGRKAALIRGPSGSGKSDLVLRCLTLAPSRLIPEAAMLVADDQIRLVRRGKELTASAPDTIRGKFEIRGLGVFDVPSAPDAILALVVDLTAPELIERLPDPEPSVSLMGVRLPLMKLAPFEDSAAAKLMLRLTNC